MPVKDICLIDANELKRIVRNLKGKQNGANCDYYTGYMSALSAIEGVIAGMTAFDTSCIRWVDGKAYEDSGEV